MSDYYVSATVRPVGTHDRGDWVLWTAKIRAENAAIARDAAVALIDGLECEIGRLDLPWDQSYARSADAILHPHRSALTCGCDPGIAYHCELHR